MRALPLAEDRSALSTSPTAIASNKQRKHTVVIKGFVQVTVAAAGWGQQECSGSSSSSSSSTWVGVTNASIGSFEVCGFIHRGSCFA